MIAIKKADIFLHIANFFHKTILSAGSCTSQTVVQATKKAVTATKLIQLSKNHFPKIYQVIGFQVKILHNAEPINES